MKVYFKNSYGKMRVIGNAETAPDVLDVIKQFLDDHNYKSYYTRAWYDEDDGMTWFDVGSWSEFFACDEDIMKGLH